MIHDGILDEDAEPVVVVCLSAYFCGSDLNCGFFMIQTKGIAMSNKTAMRRKPSR